VRREFEYLESEIKILKVIGSGDYAVVYRITAGGKALKEQLVSTAPKAKKAAPAMPIKQKAPIRVRVLAKKAVRKEVIVPINAGESMRVA